MATITVTTRSDKRDELGMAPLRLRISHGGARRFVVFLLDAAGHYREAEDWVDLFDEEFYEEADDTDRARFSMHRFRLRWLSGDVPGAVLAYERGQDLETV